MVKNELRHHGILGQKWGVRRYQNKDGTLTSAGRRHQYKEFKKDRKELTNKILESQYPAQKHSDAQKDAARILASKTLVKKYGEETVASFVKRENVEVGIKFSAAILGASVTWIAMELRK